MRGMISLSGTQTLLQALSISNQPLYALNIDGNQQGLKIRFSPADNRQQIGHSSAAQNEDIQRAVASASTGTSMEPLGAKQRADIIDKAADLLERDCAELIAVISLEAGRTLMMASLKYRLSTLPLHALQARQLAADPSQSYTGRVSFVY